MVIFPPCERGASGSIPIVNNYERAWNGPGLLLHSFSVRLQCTRAKSAALQPTVCYEPGLLMRLRQSDSFRTDNSTLGPDANVCFHGHSHRGVTCIHRYVGRVVAHLAMQAYDNLALEDNLIWRLVKRHWADVAFPASTPVPSSSQPKEADQQLALPGEDLVISPTCEVGVSWKDQLRKDLEWSWFLSPTSVP